MYARSDYSYTLPKELIAQEAVHPHHDAKLMIIDRTSGALLDESTFWHLDRYIPKDRVIFFNNSRVLRARIRLEDILGETASGDKIRIHEGEILFSLKKDDGTFEGLVRPGNKFKVGNKITIGKSVIEVIALTEDGRLMRISGETIEKLMEEYGELPLPPYIAYDRSKEEDYQTTFAERDGSVAAPTASLHFTKALLEKIPNEKKYITLHVGLGTFKSVDTTDIREYNIHDELVEIDITLFDDIARMKNNGRKVLAVGTTVCRTLESLPYLWREIRGSDHSFPEETRSYWDSLMIDLEVRDYITWIESDASGERIFFHTKIFLYPGVRFRVVDDLITNFHLPESSLLMLVSAMIGRDEILEIYEKAIEKQYRFFSFWDGMYIRGENEK